MPQFEGRLSRFIDKRISQLQSKKSQSDIAQEAGFINVNYLSMIKNGKAKLPLDRVPALAKALDVDEDDLFTRALEQQFPLNIARRINSVDHKLTRNEQDIILFIREIAGEDDPALTEPRKELLKEAFAPAAPTKRK